MERVVSERFVRALGPGFVTRPIPTPSWVCGAACHGAG